LLARFDPRSKSSGNQASAVWFNFGANGGFEEFRAAPEFNSKYLEHSSSE
jgi:hypothetical protein